MVESTVRAERLDLPSSPAEHYLWTVPQKPVAVKLAHSLISRLEHDTVEAFRSLTSRGSEIGGLLLGMAAPGNPVVVTVENYELIECDYSRGPLYRLSDADTGRFARAIEKHSGGPARAIGYFRSHTRKGLTLDGEDLAFFDAHLREPHQFILLVRPYATKASTAGIFIRENGRIAGENSLLEFPFRVSELGAAQLRSRAESVSSQPQSSAPLTVPSLEPPPAPKPAARAQIVPIAQPRRDPQPEIQPAPAPKPAPVPQAAAPAPVIKPKEPEKSKDVEKPKETVKAKEPEKVKEKEKEPEKTATAVAEVEEKAVPPSFVAEDAPAESTGSKKMRVLLIAAAAMIVLVGGGLFLTPTLLHRGAKTPTTAQDVNPLQLRVERTSGGLLLTWNRDAESIRGAARVNLLIGDGDRHENIEMDPNQVRTGSILYPPISQDVSFQMEVTDSKSKKTASESLRVLDPRPSPLAAPAANAIQQAANGKPATTPGTPAIDTTAAANAAPAEETAAQAPAKAPTPSRPFDRESLAARLRPVASTDLPLPDAPSVTRGGAVNATGISGIVTGAAPLAPPPPRSAETAGRSAANASPMAGGKIVPAEPIFKKSPEYPKIARQTGASGAVQVEATIGADGRVKNAKVSKGNPMLQKAAIDAVMEWRYRPAMLNGTPVESPVQITLNFVPDK